MLYKTCCLGYNIFIRRNTALPPRNQSGTNVDFIQRRNVFNFPTFHTHSTRNTHRKRETCRQKFTSKITPGGNRRDWTCRSHELDFNTAICIVKTAHSAHHFNQDFDDASNDRIQSLFREPKLYYFPHIVFCRAFRHRSAFVYNNGLTPGDKPFL